jgi:hypothetical protein
LVNLSAFSLGLGGKSYAEIIIVCTKGLQMEDKELQPVIEQLEQFQFDKPALVVMPPDSQSFLQGNRGGLVYLAIASLRAATGRKQIFKDNPWLVVEDYDFDLAGIELDEAADICLPPVLSKWQIFKNNFFGYAFVIVFLAMFGIGFVTSVNFLIRPFR